jgi:hypothetical protein
MLHQLGTAAGALLSWSDTSDQIAATIPLAGIVGGVIIAITAIATKAWRDTTKRKHYEESRREIAAYVAEGSITPADAERLLSADASPQDSSNPGCSGRA